MTSHRRLLAIILREDRRRGQFGFDEINGVGLEGVDALGVDVAAVLFR